jgi:hypothetical protein
MTIRPRAVIVGVVVLVVLAAGVVTAVILTSGNGTADTFAIHGTVSVSCTSMAACSGYSDIDSGAQVEVLNQHNEVLGVGSLTENDSSTGYAYSFLFTVSGVPRGEGLYGVHVGNANRGVIWKPEDQAATTGFQLVIGS